MWALTSGCVIGDKKIKGFQGGIKFKVNKQSKVIEKLDQVCQQIKKELDGEIKKGNAPGNQNVGTLPFAYYPQGLKNTVASLL